jgi:hypothetical protein
MTLGGEGAARGRAIWVFLALHRAWSQQATALPSFGQQHGTERPSTAAAVNHAPRALQPCRCTQRGMRLPTCARTHVPHTTCTHTCPRRFSPSQSKQHRRVWRGNGPTGVMFCLLPRRSMHSPFSPTQQLECASAMRCRSCSSCWAHLLRAHMYACGLFWMNQQGRARR